jgi:hypothetical protein
MSESPPIQGEGIGQVQVSTLLGGTSGQYIRWGVGATWSALVGADITTGLGYTPENVANKGVASGYCDLDASALVPASRITAARLEAMLGYTPVNKAGDTMTGNLVLELANPNVTLLSPDNTSSPQFVLGQTDYIEWYTGLSLTYGNFTIGILGGQTAINIIRNIANITTIEVVNGNLQINNSIISNGRILNQTSATAAYTVAATDEIILANAATAAFTVTLPASSAAKQIVRIKKTDSSANAVTIAAAGTDTIDGSATKVLSAQYSMLTVISDGAGHWLVMGSM